MFCFLRCLHQGQLITNLIGVCLHHLRVIDREDDDCEDDYSEDDDNEEHDDEEDNDTEEDEDDEYDVDDDNHDDDIDCFKLIQIHFKKIYQHEYIKVVLI